MKKICHDCSCKEGELHDCSLNCDMEVCPKCKGQLLSCNCRVKDMTCDNKFIKIKKEAFRREPYFQQVFCCERCGKIFPDDKMVSDKEWKFICGATYPLDCILCVECMEFITDKRNKLKEKR